MASICWSPDAADHGSGRRPAPASGRTGGLDSDRVRHLHDTESGPLLLPEAAGIHLRRTLECGQAFRWRWQAPPHPRVAPRRGEGLWDAGGSDLGAGVPVAVGIVGRRVFRIAQDAQGLWLLSPADSDARHALLSYLGVRTAAPGGAGGADHLPIGRIEATLATDRTLARILPHTSGITLLAQDPWEVLISFIVSQNNNIPKIGQSIERLARALGEPLDGAAPRAHAFPSPERLAAADPHTLRSCLLGYRAPYVRAAARLIADGRLDLAALRRAPLEEARAALLRIPGVGEKVGDCVLLFGLRHMTAFPVDVWVRRAVEQLYFRGRRRSPREIRAFARDRFGALAGYAQQHLYAYARAHLRDAGRSARRDRDLAPARARDLPDHGRGRRLRRA